MARGDQFHCLIPEQINEFNILPCPWCGEFTEEKQNFLSHKTDRHAWHSIHCDGCGACSEASTGKFVNAVKHWNSRSDLSDKNEFIRGVEYCKKKLIEHLSK